MIRSISLFLCMATCIICMNACPLSAQDISPADKMKQCRDLLRQAHQHIDGGDLESALSALDSVLLCDERNPDAYYHKSRVHLLHSDTTLAIQALEKGMELAPLSTRLKLLAVRLYYAREMYDDAAKLLDAVLAIKPREGEAIYLRGVSLLHAGDTVAAIDAFARAIDIGLSREE